MLLGELFWGWIWGVQDYWHSVWGPFLWMLDELWVEVLIVFPDWWPNSRFGQ